MAPLSSRTRITETYPLHTHHPIAGRDYGFTGSVAVAPYTDENPVAHGNIVRTETCWVCGAQRRVNLNAGQREESPWGPSQQAREAAERAAQIEGDRLAMARAGVRVVAVRRGATGLPTEILIQRTTAPGVRTHTWHPRPEVRAAACQPDTGDGLVPVYRGILHAAETAPTAAVP